jgi:uncharacterized protein YdeI (YjbR/CyaY-like superfamily)
MCVIVDLMKTSYTTTILGFGNHAAIEIPEEQLKKIGGNRRAPLKITVNNYTYQSTATGMNGKCLVVFPKKDREEAGVDSGDTVKVELELDSGYREVIIPNELKKALKFKGLSEKFENLTYSKRKEFARQVSDAKSLDTKERRIEKIINQLSG